MTDKGAKEYLKMLIQRCGYDDHTKDRIGALFGSIKNKNILDIGAGKG